MTSEIGRYKILSEIGRGGMGIVYQAMDRDRHIVAIKKLVMDNIDPAKHQEFQDRFRREAATAARLRHPNIVDVYDVSVETDEEYFYVMEFLEGHSLRRELEHKGGKLSPLEYMNVLSQVAEGLSFAHSMNVVHRDVKPDNIFILKDGRVKITDFGIARVADFEQTQLTKTGVMLGTLAYVSPEQLQDAKNVDHRADIFSLGVVSYESLSGQVPFTGDGIAGTIVKIVSQEEKPLHILSPSIGVEMSSVVSKALRKKARDRYRSVMDFLHEFEHCLTAGKRQTTSQDASDVGATQDIPKNKAMFAADQQLCNIQQDWQKDKEKVLSELGKVEAGLPNFAALAASRQEEATGEFPVVPSPQPSPQPKEFNTDPGIGRGRGADETKRHKTGNIDSGQHYDLLSPVLIIDGYGKDNHRFEEPAVIAYRSARLIIADSSSRKVHMFSADGRWVRDVVPGRQQGDAPSATMGGHLTKPSGIAIDAKNRFYVCDSSDHYIRVFDGYGVFVKDFRNIQGKDAGLQGIALDSTGLLYVSDAGNGCLHVFQSELGLWMRKIGQKGMKEGDLQLPAGLCIDRLNQVYCADYGNSRITVFNKAGQFIRSFGGKGTANGLFNVPRAVAVDNNDKIYVLDSLNHRVQVFDPTGSWLYTFGGKGVEAGRFIAPSDLTIDAAHNLLYVTDKGNKRVQVFELKLV